MKPAMLTLIAIAVFALCGCGGGGAKSLADPKTPMGRASSPTTPTQTPTSLPVLKSGWQVVRRWARGEPDSFGAADEANVVLVISPDTGPGYSAVETINGRSRFRHFAGAAPWQTQNGWLTATRAVFLDIDLPHRLTRLSVFTLPGGQPAQWADGGKLEDVSPEANVGGAWMAYITGSPDTRMCLTGLDLQSLQSARALCGRHGEILSDPKNVAARIVFSRLVHSQDPNRRCKTLTVMDMRSGTTDLPLMRAIAKHAYCRAWSGVPLRGGVAWEEDDPASATFGTSSGFYVDESGTITELGQMATDSMVACGGDVFWLRSAAASARIMVWAPGQHRPEVMLDPGRNRLPTSMQCTEDRFLTTRVDDIGGKNEKLTLLRLDTRG